MTSQISPDTWNNWLSLTQPSERLDDLQDGRNWLIDVFKAHQIDPPKGDAVMEVVRIPGEDVEEAMYNCRLIFQHPASPDPLMPTKTEEALFKLAKIFLEESENKTEVILDENGLQVVLNPFTTHLMDLEEITYRFKQEMGENIHVLAAK